MNLQRLYSYTRQAVDDYRLIRPGDHIAIGISGGKDSLTLLYALSGLKRFYPAPFELTAVTVDLGYRPFDLSGITELCRQLQVPYHVIPTRIAEILAASDNPDRVCEKRLSKDPQSAARREYPDEARDMTAQKPQKQQKPRSHCSLCARLRKGALNQAALELGCSKIAYAHHMDDMVETAMMSLIFEGRFYAFPPATALSRTELTVIRPLMYVPEAEIRGFQNKFALPAVKNPCPADGNTKRSEIKQLLSALNQTYPGVKKRIFHAIQKAGFPDWPARDQNTI